LYHYLLVRLEKFDDRALFHSDIYGYNCFSITKADMLVYELKGMCTYKSEIPLPMHNLVRAKCTVRSELRAYHDTNDVGTVPYVDATHIVHLA